MFYNEERNHQRLAKKIIRPEFPVFPVEGDVCCRKRLGGLLRYYYRKARLVKLFIRDIRLWRKVEILIRDGEASNRWRLLGNGAGKVTATRTVEIAESRWATL